MQLSPKPKLFSQFFSAFPKSFSNLKYLEKNDDPQNCSILEIIDYKKHAYLNG